jgi:16S rRNA processing protein RimM
VEVGRIDRAHGIRGEVIVRLLTTEADRVAPGTRLVARSADGERTLRIVSSRPHQDRWLVEFDGVAGRSAAEALARTTLLAEPVVDDPDGYWIRDLIGSDVVDVGGTERGRVVNVVANPAADLLELDDGTLVPLTFATWAEGAAPGDGHDGPNRLVVDGPAGLFGDD